ncbi:hypothetical protein [Listeria booriae]|uniref:hypothetical protein n=1 Tax=Listeria booriae TaxID=1552123 RepID=UPI0021ADDC3C|nr:hypothetical protein [Listeria booriae]
MDVKYKESEWERSEKALQTLIGLGWGKGATDYLKKINKNFEDAQHDIQKDDSDGVISFSFTDKESNYQKIFEKMETLHDYASGAGRLVERVIDEPFYKDIDKFVEKMESLSIDNYETKNTIGATQIISTGAYNYGMGPATTEVKKDKIHLKDIMAGDNFFADNLKAQFAEYSKQNPEQKFTYDQYQSAVSSSRAFAYDSIRDDQQNIEFWRDIGIAVVIIGTSILCPPAGLALGIAYGTLELSSATSGKDWLTGREMDGGERTTRGAFALLDIIPGVKGIRAFSQATKAGGLVLDAAQVGSKLTLKQAGKQGLSNLDSIGKQAFRESAERVRKIPNVMKDATSAIKIQVKNGTVQAGKITDGVVTGVKNLNFSRTRVVADSIGGTHAMFDVAENTHRFEKLAKELVDGSDEIRRLSNGTAKNIDEMISTTEKAADLSKLTPADIPTSKSGNFNDFFNSLSVDELDEIWKDKALRKKIERQLRAPGGLHEWHLVSRAPQFKFWDTTAEQIKDLRTAISDVKFINPKGAHGSLGSTKAHNELLAIIDSSSDYKAFTRRLNNWAHYRLEGGVSALPEGLRISL